MNVIATRAKRFRTHSRRASFPETSQMHPEGRLLVLCARTTINDFVRVEVEDLVGESIDWEEMWQLSKAHGVAPLVYRSLLTVCAATVPAPIHDAFRRHLQLNGLCHALLIQELTPVLTALTAKGVRAIPFKGVILGHTAYGDQSLRECTALNLIVDKESISSARQVLWSQGYQCTSLDSKDGRGSDESYHSFRKRNGIIAVNLQWSMSRRHFSFRLDRAEFWERLKPVHLPNQSIMGLSPEDLLIVLCVYGSKQAWRKLKWTCDVAELVRRRPTLDWSRMVFQADEWKCRRMVMLGLAMARNLFDITLPRAILHELDDDAETSALVHRMPEQLLKNTGHGIGENCAEALYLTLQDSWWERCKLGVALCREQSHVISQPLPWCKSQGWLRKLFAFCKPFQWVMVKCVPSSRLRRILIRCLE